MLKELTVADFDISIEKGASVVEFYTPTCGHCKKLAGVLDKLSDELGDKALFGHCDIEANSFLQGRFDISAVPTVIFFKDGQVANKLVGEVHPLILTEEIKKLQ